ncbi:PP0621 family protein [Thauera sp.]|uniref:PP0621 family protein n=1 Tax=Thauera sp. TaxID=1905334 RepID=UPI0039E72733
MRNLLILILVIAGIWWIRRAMARIGKKPAKGKDGRADIAAERVLECAHCGINVPESEGVRAHGRFYCSDAHRLAGPRQ